MKAGAGKNKGGGFEIQICRRLSLWITGAEKPEIFWRSASSGAKATVDRKKKVSTKMNGDIMAIDPRGEWLTKHFFIECKFYKDIRFEDLVKKKGQLYEFWKKCLLESEEANLKPLLIFKRNMSRTYILFDDIILKIENHTGTILPRTIFIDENKNSLYLFDFESLIKNIPAESVEFSFME